MNESFDDLERELQSLRPRQPSPQLRTKIEDRLAAPLIVRQWRMVLAAAACMAVAGTLIVLFSRPAASPIREPDPPPMVIQTPPIDSTKPSLIAYQRALRESEQSLSDLLDAHAAAAIPHPSSDPARQPETPLRWRDVSPLINSPTETEHRL